MTHLVFAEDYSGSKLVREKNQYLCSAGGLFPADEAKKEFKMVHGDIRHLENWNTSPAITTLVHGDIRHLENNEEYSFLAHGVHGDIRHLENIVQ